MKLLVILSLIAASHGFIFGPSQDWDGLRVTWGINPFSSYTFAPIPRTASQALQKGWLPMNPAPGENYFCGKRYIKYENAINAQDTAVMPIYDKNGYIAGIQSGIPDNLPSGWPTMSIRPPFIHEPSRRMYTLTAYFSPPDVVCGAGRTQAQYDSEGTGTELHFLLANRTNTVKMPYREADIGSTNWVKGKCFFTMGQHYWYNVTADMPCDRFIPGFLMYNKGRINSFGFAFFGDFPSPRYEHPSLSNVGTFMKPVPNCFTSQSKFSTIHIYMDDSPRTNTC